MACVLWPRVGFSLTLRLRWIMRACKDEPKALALRRGFLLMPGGPMRRCRAF
jgi:hypothetical protein